MTESVNIQNLLDDSSSEENLKLQLNMTGLRVVARVYICSNWRLMNGTRSLTLSAVACIGATLFSSNTTYTNY